MDDWENAKKTTVGSQLTFFRSESSSLRFDRLGTVNWIASLEKKMWRSNNWKRVTKNWKTNGNRSTISTFKYDNSSTRNNANTNTIFERKTLKLRRTSCSLLSISSIDLSSLALQFTRWNQSHQERMESSIDSDQQRTRQWKHRTSGARRRMRHLERRIETER